MRWATIRGMTFPLGSLGSGASTASAEGAYTRKRARKTVTPAATPAWRAQTAVLFGAVLWLLALLALATHNAGDAAFSTSGSSPVTLNRAGVIGAWFSDLAYFAFGYSAWWIMAATLRAWLGALARLLRSDAALPMVPPLTLAVLDRPRAAARRELRARMDAPVPLGVHAARPCRRRARLHARAAQHEAARLRRLGRAVDRDAAGGPLARVPLLVAGACRGDRRAPGRRARAARRAHRTRRGSAPRRGGAARARAGRRGRDAVAGRTSADRHRARGGRGAEVRTRREGAPEAALRRACRHQAAAGRPARRRARAAPKASPPTRSR